DEPKPPAEGKKVEDEAPETPKVRTVHPKRVDFQVETTQVCSLHAFEPASIYAPIAGRVSRRDLVRLGDRVKAGQVLAEIAGPEMTAEVAQAQAAVRAAEAANEGNRAKLAEARLAAKNAEATVKYRDAQLKRYEQL